MDRAVHRTGAWSDINTTSSTERRTRTYQTLWFDHGTDPVGASYAYLRMPGASRRTLAARAADEGWLHVLDNTADRQAVAVPSLGLTAANRWRAGTVGDLTVTAPASVLVRRRRSVLAVAGLAVAAHRTAAGARLGPAGPPGDLPRPLGGGAGDRPLAAAAGQPRNGGGHTPLPGGYVRIPQRRGVSCC
ncbi:hypothetical protein GCM10010272_58730 [Streptomyces lateritius]|nr:hypothetical protein GCM10010272_58730 [Streptomyces lateritius]